MFTRFVLSELFTVLILPNEEAAGQSGNPADSAIDAENNGRGSNDSREGTGYTNNVRNSR